MPYKDPIIRKQKSAESQRIWYSRHKDEPRVKDMYRTISNKRKISVKSYINTYKSRHPCIKCGESFIQCLHFHHTDSTSKEFAISKAIRGGYSIARIEEEISKCIVLCANCHAKVHWGYYSV